MPNIVEIPKEAVIPGKLDYYIQASDGVDPDGNIRTSISPEAGRSFQVQVRSGSYGALASLEIQPAGTEEAPLELTAGDNIKFTVTGRDSAGLALPVEVVWTATGAIGHVGQDGFFASSGNIIGDGMGTIIATAKYTSSGKILESRVNIRLSPGPPAHIALMPASATITAGGSCQFYATITDGYGNVIDAANAGLVKWTLDAQTQIGTLGDSGRFDATRTGNGSVVAKLNDLQAVSEVTVMPGRLQRLEISTSDAEASSLGHFKSNHILRFKAAGFDAFGRDEEGFFFEKHSPRTSIDLCAGSKGCGPQAPLRAGAKTTRMRPGPSRQRSPSPESGGK